MSLRIALSVVLLLAAGSAVAEDFMVTVTAIEVPNKTPINIVVHRRTKDQSGPMDLGLSSTHTFPETECSLNVSYRAEPVEKRIFTRSASWQPCQKTKHVYTFEFSRPVSVKYAQLAEAFSSQNVEIGATFRAAGAEPGIEIIGSLIEAGDLGSTSFVANEMAIALEKTGSTEQSKYFRYLALSAGLDAAIAGAAADPSAAYFTYDVNGPFAFSPEALESIAAYQASAGLDATGDLNWPTIKSMSRLASEDIVKLEAYKRAAIEPICAACIR